MTVKATSKEALNQRGNFTVWPLRLSVFATLRLCVEIFLNFDLERKKDGFTRIGNELFEPPTPIEEGH